MVTINRAVVGRGAAVASPDHSGCALSSTVLRTALRSPTDWVNEIRQAWARGAANILEIARLMHEAKAATPRGMWEKLVAQMPVSRSHAYMLILIGREIAGVQNSGRLPPAWNTLYEN